MCVAELNVSTLPCQHRWYHLLWPCQPSTNLTNCTSKLALEGWEIKCSFCPFCSSWNDPTQYRLVGSDLAPSIGGLSRTPSLTVSLSSARRDSRRGSLARTDSSTSVTGLGALGGLGVLTQREGEKNKAMNSRIEAYFAQLPDRFSRRESSGKEDDEQGSPTSEASDTMGMGMERDGGLLGKGWRKGKRISRGFFR